MCHVLPIATVALLLGISDETVRRSLKYKDETGDVLPAATGAKRGRKTKLDDDARKVSIILCSFLLSSIDVFALVPRRDC